MSVRIDFPFKEGMRFLGQHGRIRQIIDIDTVADITWCEVDSQTGELLDKMGDCTRKTFAAWCKYRVFNG